MKEDKLLFIINTEVLTFAVDAMEFLKLLYDSRLLNFYFEKEVNKVAPNLINQVKLTNTPRE